MTQIFKKGKVVPVYAMKAYRERKGTFSVVLNPGCGGKQVVSFMSQLLYPPKAGWALEPIWTDCADLATPAPDDTDFKLMVIACRRMHIVLLQLPIWNIAKF
jgi:hypothetical protein